MITKANVLLVLVGLFYLAMAAGCKSKSETDSYLVMAKIQDWDLTYHMNQRDREVLRQQIEQILKWLVLLSGGFGHRLAVRLREKVDRLWQRRLLVGVSVYCALHHSAMSVTWPRFGHLSTTQCSYAWHGFGYVGRMYYKKLVDNERGLGIIAILALVSAVGVLAGAPKAPNAPPSTKERVAILEEKLEILAVNQPQEVHIQKAMSVRVKKRASLRQILKDAAKELKTK